MLFLASFFMPKIRKSYINKLSSERTNNVNLNTVNENPYEKLPAELQVGSWYRGNVIGFSRDRPVVSLSSKHCKVPLFGCNEKVQRGDTVIFEVTSTRGYLAVGEFREFLLKSINESQRT